MEALFFSSIFEVEALTNYSGTNTKEIKIKKIHMHAITAKNTKYFQHE